MERNVQLTGDEPAALMRSKLADAYSGIHHLPFLLHGSGVSSMTDVGLETYEVFGYEPLHGTAGHTKNLYAEIPGHLFQRCCSEV